MRKPLTVLAIAALLPLTGGCIAKTAFDIATMPVKAGAQAADWATTSQDEADRNYGRKMRKKEAEEGRAMKKAEKERQRHEGEKSEDDEG